jgi:hypothetical protein
MEQWSKTHIYRTININQEQVEVAQEAAEEEEEEDFNSDEMYDLPNTPENQLEAQNVFQSRLIDFKITLAEFRRQVPRLQNVLELSQRQLAEDPDDALHRQIFRMFKDIQMTFMELRFSLIKIVQIIRMLNCFSQALHFESFAFGRIGRVLLPEIRILVRSVLSENEVRFLRQYVTCNSNLKKQCVAAGLLRRFSLLKKPEEENLATLLLDLPHDPEPQFEMVLAHNKHKRGRWWRHRRPKPQQPRSLFEQSLDILFPILVKQASSTHFYRPV